MLTGWALAVALLASGGPSRPPAPVEAAAAVTSFRNAPAQSALALARAAEAHPRIAPALTLLQAEAQLAAGARDKARRLALKVAHDAPRFAVPAHWIAARAAMPGDCEGALDSLADAPATPHWVPTAPRLMLQWQAELACKRAEAGTTRRTLALEWPESDEGQKAGSGLELTPQDHLVRAEALERARSYPAAEAELTGLLGGPLADEARFRIGRLHLERLRDDFGLAERAFAQVAAGSSERAGEAAYLRARALGRAGDAPAAATAYEAFLAKFPDAPQAADARFFRAFLDYENGRFPQAAQAFALIAEGPWVAPARWYRAFSLYLAEAPDAVAALDALTESSAAGAPDRLTLRRTRYWAARARETTAPAEARTRLLALAREDPFDWYSLLVRRRFPGALPPIAALPKRTGKAPSTRPPARFRAVAEEINQLAAAGLHDFARRALDEAWPALRKADQWPLMAELSRASEDYGRLYRSAQTRNRRLLDQPPVPADAALWRDAYPLGWPTALKAAARDGLRPTHLATFILKESAFDPDAVSQAHAIGLMQLIGPTAHGILVARGEEDRPIPDLFRPEDNIDLGGWYLGALSRRFDGQLPLIAAAYNAGPPSVVGWFRGRTRAPLDLFVENIPFRETREYVKKIASLHAIYEVVHEGRTLDRTTSELPMELDLTVREGVDF